MGCMNQECWAIIGLLESQSWLSTSATWGIFGCYHPVPPTFSLDVCFSRPPSVGYRQLPSISFVFSDGASLEVPARNLFVLGDAGHETFTFGSEAVSGVTFGCATDCLGFELYDKIKAIVLQE
ncbi:hypothetical protein C1H46_003384 [Malus baccata]|uniref:Uncharacterized protein n=1 Tax=Malus baccata TaxID=106549 RepID=A0A540NIY3_MALBA|nr:hypothetical protein C1H46_003384 [Malus baccata]